MKLSRWTAPALILLAILVLYGRTLSYGLVWDDFVALRPLSWSAILGAWTGPWDPAGIWPVFYRPLSIAAYQTVFRWFGHDAFPLHVVNLVELFIVAWMVRAFVRRETSSDGLGLLAALLLILHPETPSSLAAWISQQFHLLALIAAVGSALTWQRMRGRGTWGWLVVLAPLAVGVLVKEDVLMMAPTLLAWQAIRARVVGDVPPLSRSSIALVGSVAALYCIWRTVALREIGGYGTPDVGRLMLNLVGGPLATFGLQWIPGAHTLSLASGLGVAILATLAWRNRRRATAQQITLALYGAALGVFANLPLILVSGSTRLHMLIFAAVLAFTAAIGVAASTVSARERTPLAVYGVVWLLVVTTANWANTNTFAPCSPETLQRNAEAVDWDVLALDVRAQIQASLNACGAPESVRLPH